jgi:hypothetical protein
MNRIYSIQYDLTKPGQSYEKLIAAIKRLCPTWAKPLESCFVVVSSITAAQLRDSLTPYLDTNDRLLVLQAGPDWASRNLAKEVSDWLVRNIG